MLSRILRGLGFVKSEERQDLSPASEPTKQVHPTGTTSCSTADTSQRYAKPNGRSPIYSSGSGRTGSGSKSIPKTPQTSSTSLQHGWGKMDDETLTTTFGSLDDYS